MAAILDDFDARPGSVASLLRTVIGLYLRELGGWIATADLVSLTGALGIEAPQARTGIARLRAKGLLVSERRGAAGYALNPGAVPMLERGDRRIFEVRRMDPAEPWCLVSFSISEDRRGARGMLRRRLQWMGAGLAAPGLWICPGHLADEAEQILLDLGLREQSTVFLSGEPRVAGELADAVARWWDLEALAETHRGFLERVAALPLPSPPSGSPLSGSPLPPSSGSGGGSASAAGAAFAGYARLVDAWRPIPYIDPGLPVPLLPRDWPGLESEREFARLSAELADPAREYVRAVTA